MTVKKAIIPAAGLGTRMLPIAKAVPKEMLPVVDKPVMQYLVEEAVESGITEILIITNRGKGAIEDYFDYCPEYEQNLEAKGKTAELESLDRIANLANVTFLRQKKPRGLGHAVLCAKSFVGDEPFAVLYGDDMIHSPAGAPTTGELIKLYEEFHLPVVGGQMVDPEWISKYSSLKLTPIRERVYKATDMIEKPKKGEEFSLFSILGRVLLTPEIFDILEHTPLGAGNELQLTDAMKTYARTHGMIAYEFPGTRHDMGSKLGFLKANVMLGANDPALGEEFRAFLKDYAKTL